jgi:superfamily II DNA or RNA helicase
MPRIFDNIELWFLPTLQESLRLATRADFCVGYFNLRGWKKIAEHFDEWTGGNENSCRLLVGMQSAPEEELRQYFRLSQQPDIDQGAVIRQRKRIAQEFRDQLTYGIPTAEDEFALRKLSDQLKAKKVIVKLFLAHQLHAKLYLVHRDDHNNPTIGFVGSSNLTFAGLAKQGELNVDVLDDTACEKLQRWFNDRWEDRWCLDISEELAEIIDTSWARSVPIPPYHIYLKIAYHLSQEARFGLTENKIPPQFQNVLFDYQKAAVQIAAHHLNKRNGVLIGDVVGLGKTIVGTALAKLVEINTGHSTLIICPKNLRSMWQKYVDDFDLNAKVMSLSMVISDLPELSGRYRTILIDESHNLRNREGRRYRVIQERIRQTDSRCILLSATPYNKTYLDLSAQLRLFFPEDRDLGVRPEALIREKGEVELKGVLQNSLRTLTAFERSSYADDWRDLMRLFLIRRTRSFIQDNYASVDAESGRKYLPNPEGEPYYFPSRIPKTLKFVVNDDDPDDPYARLATEEVVGTIGGLWLPRYGLGNYISADAQKNATASEKRQIEGLSRAGKRLMGYSRTNIFKRLESGGLAFLLSVERHILRNYIFLYAIENGLPLPIGSQGSEYLDTTRTDEDENDNSLAFDDPDIEAQNDTEADDPVETAVVENDDHTVREFKARAEGIYKTYANQFRKRFKWINSRLFKRTLAEQLNADAESLCRVLQRSGTWSVDRDTKFQKLLDLLKTKHPNEKVLVFTQFADTAMFLGSELKNHGITQLAYVTGNSSDPTEVACRFSPKSNAKKIGADEELRVLIATDVLSEGQNLQDSHIVVNYDLPWAIIRLIQRAGRVDRIGQKAEKIICYSFLPSDGVNKVIKLRERVQQRLRENAEVVGTDEAFFEDELRTESLTDLYHEKSGILDDERDAEVDLASQAFQIWKNAIDADPKLEKIIPDLPPVSYSTRSHNASKTNPDGVLVYVKTADETDALTWINRKGESVTQSQLAILQAAACSPETPAIPRDPDHFDLVRSGVELIVQEEKLIGGQLGRPSGARYRVYQKLKSYIDEGRGTLFDALPESKELERGLDDIYRYPLRQGATDLLNKRLREGIGNHQLAELVMSLREDDILSRREEETEQNEPQIICSMGLFEKE